MKLSIGVPCLNEKEKLEVFLNSIINQTVAPEVIIVDGGSSDGSIEIIRKFQNQHKNIKLYKETGRYKSPANARNQALMFSTGEIFTFMDVDETISLDYTEKVIEAFKRHKNADCIEMRMKLIKPDQAWGIIHTISFYRDNRKKIDSILKNKIPKSFNLFRTSFLKDNAPIFEATLGFGEDRLIGHKIKPKVVYSNLTVWRFRTHSILNLRGFRERYVWYGRTIPYYLKKSKDVRLLLPYTLAVLSLFVPPLLFIPFLRGLYFMTKWFKIHHNWKLILEPFLELSSWIFISLGFFQYLFCGNQNRGKGK